MHGFLLSVCLSLMCTTMAQAENAEEVATIRLTALAYMEVWYDGDADRMKASLHPKLAKRILKGIFGEPGLRHTSASDMIR